MFKRIIKSFFALIFQQVIVRFGSLILVPIYLHFWGPTIYGEWLTIWSLVGYIFLFDLGIQQATINMLTKEYARNGYETYKHIQGTTLSLFLLLAILISVISTLITFNFDIAKIFNVIEAKKDFPFVFLLLSIYLAFSFPVKFIISQLNSIGQLHKAQWIQNVVQVLMLVATFVLLNLNYKFIAIAISQIALQLLSVVGVLILFKYKYPILYPKPELPDMQDLRKVILPSFYFLLIMLANIIWFQGSIMLVSVVYGGIVVSMFSITRTLTQISRQFTNLINVAFTPEITRLEGEGSIIKNASLHNLIVLLSVSVVSLLTGFLWVWGAKIIEIWTLHKIIVDELLLKFMLLLILFQTPYLASSSFVMATNKHSSFAKLFFISQSLGIMTSLVLLEQFGLITIPLSFIFWEGLFCNHFVLNNNCKLLNITYNSFSILLWSRLIIVTILIIFINLLTFKVPIKSFILLIISSFFISTAFIVVFVWYLWMNTSQKMYISSKFNLVKNKMLKTRVIG